MKNRWNFFQLIGFLIFCGGFFSCASIKTVADSPRFAVLTMEEDDALTEENEKRHESKVFECYWKCLRKK